MGIWKKRTIGISVFRICGERRIYRIAPILGVERINCGHDLSQIIFACVFLARSITPWPAVKMAPTKMAMIRITTVSSINVNALEMLASFVHGRIQFYHERELKVTKTLPAA
jgi:hypothetical protein